MTRREFCVLTVGREGQSSNGQQSHGNGNLRKLHVGAFFGNYSRE
jgi:hypothetical protein